MMKEIVILILVLLVVGLYFSPEITKSIMKATGHSVIDVSKEGASKLKESETAKNLSEKVKETFNFKNRSDG